MITFTPDGTKVMTANEGEPNSYGQPTSFDPEGSVSVIDMSNGAANATVTHATFTAFNSFATVLKAAGVRIYGPGANAARDIEPEYIAINKAGTQAWVTLQEHNAIATLDLTTNQFTGITGLGLKDYSLAANGNTTPVSNAIDPSNVSPIALTNVALKGAYQPDAIATYEVGGQTFLVMANEGDFREDGADEKRAGDLYGTAAPLNRINVLPDLSAAGNLVSAGGRSFSIRDADGDIVFDSGNILEAEAIARGIYADARSDDKGVEPEGVALQTIGGRTFAFIGLERTSKGAVGVFDITDPANASFVNMIVTPDTERPEGLTTFVKDNMVYLAIANEGDDGDGMSTAVYSLAPVPEPETWAMLLAGLGLLGLRARRKQPV